MSLREESYGSVTISADPMQRINRRLDRVEELVRALQVTMQPKIAVPITAEEIATAREALETLKATIDLLERTEMSP